MIDLESIIVLYRDRNLQLWGIPYRMRADVGQSPRHLQDANNTKRWIWLGSPGWWGSMSKEDRRAVEAWLAGLDVPGGFCEWSYVEDCGRMVSGTGKNDYGGEHGTTSEHPR